MNDFDFLSKYICWHNMFFGPTPLPFVGNMLTLAKYEPGYGAFDKWKKEFGPVFTYWLGKYYNRLKDTSLKITKRFRKVRSFSLQILNFGKDIGLHGLKRIFFKFSTTFSLFLLLYSIVSKNM